MPVQKAKAKAQFAIVFICPWSLGSYFQVCVIFGETKWRSRGSTSASCLFCTVRDGDMASSDIKCTREEYQLVKKFQHYDALFGDRELALKVRDVFGRTMLSYSGESSVGEWCGIKIPPVPGDDFPDRPEVRSRLTFGATGRQENLRICRKNYRASFSHSSGILTVQCVCRHPKLLELPVMLECEGVSTALSVRVSQFKLLPAVTYYDNAYNVLKSIVQRISWVNEDTLIVCDQFYYKSHACNSVCDPDSHKSYRSHSTSGAVSINHL